MPWKQRSDGDGGTLIMRPGKKLRAPYELCRQDLIRLQTRMVHALSVLHQGGRVHCDVRRSNIIEIGDSFQLIDYGFSRLLNNQTGSASVVITVGGQRNGLGERLRQWLANDENASETSSMSPDDRVDWMPNDDFEMLFEAITPP
jgi:hypothetical protein